MTTTSRCNLHFAAGAGRSEKFFPFLPFDSASGKIHYCSCLASGKIYYCSCLAVFCSPLDKAAFLVPVPLLLCRQRVSIPYDRNEHQDCSILFGDWLLGEWGPGGRPAPFSIPPDQPICVKSNCNRSRPAVAGIVASWAKKPRPSSRGSRSVGNGIISQAAWPGP